MTASVMKELNGFLVFNDSSVKRCVRYVFASLFCKSKGKHLWNKEKWFLFHFESSFRFLIKFQVFRYSNVKTALQVEQSIQESTK